MKILDCTLRDGGYYTSWDFSESLVKKYLKAMDAAKVDVVELGLRNFPSEQFVGAHAYTTDSFIRELNVPKSLEVAVMVDAKNILGYSGGVAKAVRKLFCSKSDSPVSIVRIASHFSEVSSCEPIATELKKLGYSVGLNLMQSGGRSSDELTLVAKNILSWNAVDILYFADSLGNMDSEEVNRIYSCLREYWPGSIGIHTHNNQGQALANSLTAVSIGINWVDSTVLGMGRGAGNAESELLLLELEKIGYKYRSFPLWNLVLEDFRALKKRYGWGASLLYHFAANHGIHPTYVQNLTSENRYTSEQIIQALTYLAPMKASSFNASLLTESVAGVTNSVDNFKGKWNANGWCEGKEVLIIGAGQSVANYKNAIQRFILKRKPITLSLNIHNEIQDELIDGFVAIDPMRIMLEIGDYHRLGKILFTSIKSLPKEIRAEMNKITVKDYGYRVEPGVFEVHKNFCAIPKLLSLAYSFSLAKIGGAIRVWLVGFDGYHAGDRRQEDMIELLDVMKKTGFNIENICLTPTTYPIKQGSIYAPY